MQRVFTYIYIVIGSFIFNNTFFSPGLESLVSVCDNFEAV